MILGFKPQFKDLILKGDKIHTIRFDRTDRWSKGRVIQFATGVRTKKYKQFMDGICTGVQYIRMEWDDNGPCIYMRDYNSDLCPWELFYEPSGYGVAEYKKLVINDGFKCIKDFQEWFNEDFEGKIIHWTDYSYAF